MQNIKKMFCFFQHEIDIEDKIKERSETLAFYGLPFQPFILVVGDKKKQFFVRLEHRMLVASSFLDAVDSTFKLFYVLSIDYPFLGVPIWQFVQQFFFEKRVPGEPKISRVTSLISELRKKESKVING
jgi:hypothetical protein